MASKELERSLIEAQISIASSLQGIQENLKILNDNNILHTSKAEEEHKSIMEQLKVLTDKYWWLIMVLIGVILVMSGYKQLTSIFLPL